MTDEEETLWRELRMGKLGIKFKRQHSIGPYILDFYCPDKKLAVELDGFVHKKTKEYDAERGYYLQNLNIKTIRFWNREVNDNIDFVIKRLKRELNLRPAKGEVPERRRG